VISILKDCLENNRRGVGEDNSSSLNVDAGVFDYACSLIRSEGTSLVIIGESGIVYTDDGRGIAPILNLFDKEKDKLKGVCVVDRVIGKAAAMILVLGGVSVVYGDVMSKVAEKYLVDREIRTSYCSLVDYITGRVEGTNCPIEGSVLDIDDPEEGLVAIRNKLTFLRSAK